MDHGLNGINVLKLVTVDLNLDTEVVIWAQTHLAEIRSLRHEIATLRPVLVSDTVTKSVLIIDTVTKSVLKIDTVTKSVLLSDTVKKYLLFSLKTRFSN